MVVEEDVAFWEFWSGRPITTSGPYKIPGAHSLVDIDLDRGVGEYEEPNVWVSYRM